MSMWRAILRGAAAGAAGTTALNAVTYLDMALRGRPSSEAPNTVVERLSDRTGVPVPGSEDRREHRIAGLGPLMGLVVGIGVGALYGALRAAGWHPRAGIAAVTTAGAAMAAADTPMAALGVSDPRAWRPSDWLSDLVPHLAYGAVTALAYDSADGADGSGPR